ncbi:MAG TPA: hypothetical protein VEI73_03185 [Candidatus Acidoferrum sp.]|nr:hypothetical protein [Candidatus Acidoferrum sp.]
MSRFEESRLILTGSFRSGPVLLLQFFLNPILFALFALWLLIAEATALQLALNVVLAIVIVAGGLLLHGGTLNYFSDRFRDESAGVAKAFGRALRHLGAIAVCAAILYWIWSLAGGLSGYDQTVPTYLRSTLPAFLRRLISIGFLTGAYDAGIFLLRWVVIPGLLLPLALRAADQGFRGFGSTGWRAWKSTVASFQYWLILTVVALIGVYASGKLMDWRPTSKDSTFSTETASLVLRLFLAYILGLFSWVLACALIGRRGWLGKNLTGDSAA